MDTLENKTIRLSEGETEMLTRALLAAAEQSPGPKPGDTQILLRQAQTSQTSGNTEHVKQTNFIL